jgi:DNA polymerase III gamma/tau subunit
MTDILINKFRPGTWEDVVGQNATVASMRKLLDTGKSQAFLLSGPPGTGKTSLARIAAAYKNCTVLDFPAAKFTGVDDMRQLTNGLDYRAFGKSGNRAIVVDECFVRGTLIDTPMGRVPIQNLCPGDKIIGAKGIDIVKCVMKKYVPMTRIVSLHLPNNDVIFCSAEHPFLTTGGWCAAEGLHGKSIVKTGTFIPSHMQKMWDSIHEQRAGALVLHKLRNHTSKKLLRMWENFSPSFIRFSSHCLFEKMWGYFCWNQTARETTCLLGSGNQKRTNTKSQIKSEQIQSFGPTKFDTHDTKQSNAFGRQYRQNDCDQKTKWNVSHMERQTGWEWNRADRSSGIITLISRWLVGISNYYKSQTFENGLANLLQSRYWFSETKIGNRNRWYKKPWWQKTAGKGSIEGIAAERVRVDHNPFHQRRNNFSSFFSRQESTQYIECYDLEIENHPSYSVNGVIVHNCHRISSAGWDALLKPIEEPPAHVFWFFCTTLVSKVPAAIKTRCSSFVLKPVSDKELSDLIYDVIDAEKFKVSDAIVDLIVGEAGGSPRQALTNLGLVYHITDRRIAAETLKSAIASEPVLELCRYLAKGGRGSWPKAMALLAALEDENPESVRIVVCNYMGKVIQNAKTDDAACAVLPILEAFSTPYNSSDGIAPLMISLGRALFVG